MPRSCPSQTDDCSPPWALPGPPSTPPTLCRYIAHVRVRHHCGSCPAGCPPHDDRAALAGRFSGADRPTGCTYVRSRRGSFLAPLRTREAARLSHPALLHRAALLHSQRPSARTGAAAASSSPPPPRPLAIHIYFFSAGASPPVGHPTRGGGGRRGAPSELPAAHPAGGRPSMAALPMVVGHSLGSQPYFSFPYPFTAPAQCCSAPGASRRPAGDQPRRSSRSSSGEGAVEGSVVAHTPLARENIRAAGLRGDNLPQQKSK